MLTRLSQYLLLPGEVTAFERDYLRRVNRVALVFFWLHPPVMMLVAQLCGTGPLRALALNLLVLAGATLAARTLTEPRSVSMTFGFVSMCMGGLLVHFGQGLMQIEMHFYFFVLLALLAVFGNPAVILLAAATAATHHLLLWLLLPRSVFNYDASIWTVVVHALFVVLESVAAIFVARSFFDNVIGLDKIVQERTRQVEARNHDMRLVLDNVNQGLLTLDRDGVVSQERSAAVDQWLGAPGPGQRFWEQLAPLDSRAAVLFRMGWEAILEDQLPLALNLDQMPRRLCAGGRALACDYQPILDPSGAVSRMLLILSDVTSQEASERLQAEQRALMAVFEKIMSNKSAFLEFFKEARQQVHVICAGPHADLRELRRVLHTLKGNFSIFGMGTLSELCHEIETRMAESDLDISPADRRLLAERFQDSAARLERLIEVDAGHKIEIDEQELTAAVGWLIAGTPRAKVIQRLATWRLQALRGRFGHIADQIRALAQRLGKGAVSVTTDDQGLRYAAERWHEFFGAFTHVVRNAVDHGLESPEERAALDKPAAGVIALRGFISGELFVIELTDDGRGIDWARVAARAAALGVPCATPDEQAAALFHDGLSTRDAASEVSGRGVGLAAVRAACARLCGEIQVDSTLGQGTTFRFLFPRSSLHGGDAALEQRLSLALAAPPMVPPASRLAAERRMGS